MVSSSCPGPKLTPCDPTGGQAVQEHTTRSAASASFTQEMLPPAALALFTEIE